MAERLPLAKTREFLALYERERPALEEAARQLERYLAQVLSDSNIDPHMIAVRVKELESVRGKLLRKDYARPRAQLTDVIGARIILYRSEEVDRVATLLRRNLKVQEKDSVDKRLTLGLREFGYRSYHLIGQVKPEYRARLDFRALRARRFEIQIRSILEHVWAEIEHSVAYKSGADLPPPLKRRFASLAAVLEMLDHEFASISAETNSLVEGIRKKIEQDPMTAIRLDVTSMLAWLEVRYPLGTGFRQAPEDQNPFPVGIEQRIVLVLRRIRCLTTASLAKLLEDQAVQQAARRYASFVGESPSTLSHLARLSLAIGVRSRETFETFFPDLLADIAMSSALPQPRKVRTHRSS